MYSKEAMDLYENLLKKVEPEVKFTEKKANASKYTDEILGALGKSSFGKETMEQLGALLPGALKKIKTYDAYPWVAGMGIPAAGLLGYGTGKQVGQASDDWDKMKYGLGGLGAGLAAPILYKALTGGKDLSALAARLGGEPYDQGYSDFTSI